MIDRDKLLAWPFAEVVQHYSVRDTMLYALSLGFGEDPMDRGQLRYLLESELAAFPTMALVLAHPGPWTADPATGIDRKLVVHGEQGLRMHRPLAPSGTVRSRNRVVDVLDKGAGKGAVIYTERQLVDDASGELIATIEGSTFCRGDGGFGGPAGAARILPTPPEREPDEVAEIRTSPQAALLYRLNGDYNPLHADPAAAARAGFERPISHGLLSFGLCGRMISQRFGRLEAIQARFAAPMYPGETLVTRMWRDAQGAVSFTGLCKERGTQVLSNGLARTANEER
jgi:acyl dehydratase